MFNEIEDLYQEVIFEHYKKPRNYKIINNPQYKKYLKNPVCGDEITIYINLENNIIKEVSFQGNGCAICIASTSLLVENIHNKNINDFNILFNEIHSFITRKTEIINIDIDKIEAIMSIRDFPSRIKCAMLPYHAIKQIIEEFEHKKE